MASYGIWHSGLKKACTLMVCDVGLGRLG